MRALKYYNSNSNTIDFSLLTLPINTVFIVLIANNTTTVIFQTDIINNKYSITSVLNNYTLYYSLDYGVTWPQILPSVGYGAYAITSNGSVAASSGTTVYAFTHP
jgi:hypothetical protein